MLTPAEIAEKITGTRDAFAEVFLQAQSGLGTRLRFDGVTQAANDRTAFTEALQHAQQKNFLEVLIDLIIEQVLDEGKLSLAIRTESGDAELEAITNRAAGVMEPDVIAKGLSLGIKWTGKISIDGAAKGTGILVASNRLLTAWHVVSELFTPKGDGYEVTPNSAPRIEIVFDDYLQSINRGQGLRGRGERRVKAHPDWCVAFSPSHPDERAGKDPRDPKLLQNYWDYAIIQLEEPIGLERSWATMDAKVAVPRAEQNVFLIQHAFGQTMKVDIRQIAAAAEQQRAEIPRIRFLHYANSANGSSGGPCFDTALYLFGIHQGKWTQQPKVTNCGIPLVRVIEHVEANFGTRVLDEPEESIIWRLGQDQGFAPVIGCDDFLQMALKSAFFGSPRLITINGSLGSGKTYRTRALAAMLPDASHLKIKLDAAKISKMNVAELVDVICNEARAPVPTLQAAAEMNSTTAVWLKDEVVKKVIDALAAVRKGRLVWIWITDLDVYDIEGENTSQMLMMLYEELQRVHWLRIVLDGMKAEVPVSLKSPAENLYFELRVGPITQEQIEIYLRRFATAQKFDLGPVIKLDAGRVYKKYIKDVDDDKKRADAAKNLANDVMEKAIEYMALAEQG